MAFWMGTNAAERKLGTAVSDHYQAMGGNDYLTGAGGGDLLHGGRGNDTVYGGSGNDTISLLGADKVYGGTGKDFFAILGISYNQMLGTQIRSIIYDFKATGLDTQKDVLELSGFRFRWADRDADFTDGFSMTQKGADVLVRTRDAGGNVQEVLLKNVALSALNTGNVKIIAPLFAEPLAAAPLDWTGTEGPDVKAGTSGADFLFGLGGDDTLRGLEGADTLNGGKGADVMYGGIGDDRIYISGGDRVTGSGGSDTFVFLDPSVYTDIANAGRATVMDFDAVGAVHDRLDLSLFDVVWAARDKGLEDGFEMLRSTEGIVVRVLSEDGSRATVLLKGAAWADLDSSDFLF